MEIETVRPAEIEKRSFEILTGELAERGIVLSGDTAPVIKRCIHTTADFEYAETLTFSPGAVEELKRLIRSGASLVTDTNMALSGINRRELEKYGAKACCFMADEDVAREAAERGTTRASVSMEKAIRLPGPVVFVSGNAPTALITLWEHYAGGESGVGGNSAAEGESGVGGFSGEETGRLPERTTPAFVIGVPVGFVNVEAAKERILRSGIPHIVNRGRKGGSNVAAAIVNAVLYQMREEAEPAGEEERKADIRGNGNSEEPAGKEKGKFGFTTGSCAAAAAKASVWMLLSGKRKDRIRIDTPAGIPYETELAEIRMNGDRAGCAVRKNAGEDPDVTDGILICAAAEAVPDGKGEVIIAGGEGVGTVTRPGLDQPVGNKAINSVPRKMIEKEVKEVMALLDYPGSVRIEISIPEGRALAARTYNPRLGIEGGISVIGTSGIVEPMSRKALLDTIRVELRQQKACGMEIAVAAPGNYGMTFMKERFGYDLDRAVKCSNFIGETVDMARETGFRRLLLVGHVGKLIKLSGGIMNTHSGEADCRMELMAAAAARCDASGETVRKILGCLTTEEACGILAAEGMEKECFAHIMERISFYLKKRAGESMEVQCMVYSHERGLLGETDRAEEYLKEVTG